MGLEDVHAWQPPPSPSRFPDVVGTQPELLAQHYTEAGFSAQAVSY
jgi:hypothetical protein